MKRIGTLSQTLLPDELIGEILLRLPVRSLLRFKCVCKSWHSLISDPQFAKSHFDIDAAPTHRVLKFINFEVDFIDVDDDSAQVVFNTPLPPRADPRYALIAGSCRGFILLELVSHLVFIDLVVWNPSTGLLKRVQDNNLLEIDPYLSGIGYDSSTDDYLVVVVTLPQARRRQPDTVVNCFSLRTNSWSFTERHTVEYLERYSEFSQGEFLNGALQLFVESDDGLCIIIVAFDVREKKLLEIPLPHDLSATESEAYLVYHMTAMGGCMCFCVERYMNNGTRVHEMWTMKEYRVYSSWTKSFTLFTGNDLRRLEYPICFTKKGEILGLNGYKKLVRIDDKGEDCPHGNYMSSSGLVEQHGLYTESLL